MSRRTRSNKQSASTSAPPPPPGHYPYQDGDVLFFRSENKLNRFITKFEKRDIHPPRFSTMQYLQNYGLAVNFLHQSQLLNFLLLSFDFINTTLIRAFYSNLRPNDNGDLVTFVNGAKIIISDEYLNAIIQLPNDGVDIHQYVGEEGALFDETTFLRQAGLIHYDPRNSTCRPTITGMDPNYRLIFYFITRVLKPRKSSHTTISQEDCKLMHAIASGARLNYCKIIKLHMYDATVEDKHLPYALLVMHFLENAGLITANGPLKNRTKHWEISESSFHGGGDHDNQPPPQNPPQNQDPNENIMNHLTRIETKVDTLTRYVQGYFDHVNYQYGAVVPFEAPPANIDMDEDDDNEN